LWRANLTLAPFVWASWAISIVYEVVLGRVLAPAPYATYQTASGLLTLLGLAASVAQAAVAYEVARRGALSTRWRTLALGGAVVLIAALGLLRAPIGHLWHMAPDLAVLTGAIAAAWLLLGVARGVAQGRERYAALGSSFVIENGARLAGTALTVGAWGVWGGFASIAFGAAAALVATAAWVPPRFVQARPLSPADAGRIAWGSALATWVPTVPLLVLRPLWPPLPFAALTAMNLFGKALVQVAAWFGLALYPRLVAEPSAAWRHWALSLLLAVGGTAAVAGGGAAVAPVLLRLIFAGRYGAQIGWFRLFFPCAVPASLFGLFVTRAMARQDGAELALLTAGGAAWTVLFLVSHAGFAAVLTDFASLALLLGVALWRQWRVWRAAGGAGV
jgi:O-antigen/teichoic acid export membrane protein